MVEKIENLVVVDKDIWQMSRWWVIVIKEGMTGAFLNIEIV